MISLEQALLNTLCWFDLWHQPLTTFECWYFLWDEKKELSQSTPEDVSSALSSLEKSGAIKIERGFWHLTDSPSYTKERLAKARWSILKRRKAERVAGLISKLPFIKLIALANTLATEGANQDSDIDLLIVVQRRRLFVGRLLVTALVQLIGWRRHGLKVADRICLSFYLADDNLSIEALAYADDPYLIYWLATLYPLTDFGTFKRLLDANGWAHKFIPHRFAVVDFRANGNEKKAYYKWLEMRLVTKAGDMLEYLARRLQLYLIKRHRNSRYGDGTSAVVVTDSILKFHESDQRPMLAINFRTKQQQILAKYSS